jgi:two-component system response regulator RegA
MNPNPKPLYKLMVIDDDELYRDNLVRAFGRRGIQAVGVADSLAALKLAQEMNPEAAIVDLRLGPESGLTVLSHLLRAHPQLRVVVLTAYGTIATALEAVKLGAINYLTKPVDVDRIIHALSGATTPQRPLFELPSPEQVEWDYINRAVHDHQGNVTRAAHALGIHRRSLQRKLKNPPPLK